MFKLDKVKRQSCSGLRAIERQLGKGPELVIYGETRLYSRPGAQNGC